jgi:hypothetical protein
MLNMIQHALTITNFVIDFPVLLEINRKMRSWRGGRLSSCQRIGLSLFVVCLFLGVCYMAPICFHTFFFVTSFSRLFWYCHVCRLLNISYLNPITNPTPLPNATLTIGAARHNPNCQGSRVYPNYQGS